MMLAWLAHPVTILAVVVLAVNDHLLKAAYPGLVTGKLSDLAGLVVAPPLLAVVIAAIARRLPATPAALAALAVSGVAFTAVKSTPAGAAVASAAWSAVTGPSVILADHTDLAALPALGLTAWVWTRARRRPASRAAIRRFGVLVVLPAAALAVAATSAPEYPDTVAVASWRNLIVVGQGDAFHENNRQAEEWLASDQDGRVWRLMAPSESAAFEQELTTLDVKAQQACVPGEPAHCYRIVPGHLRVEETVDAGATWTVSWEVPDGKRQYLARSYEGLDDVTYLSSQALAVHPTPGGYVVVVANGRDGCAVRDVTGHWERIGFGAYGRINAPPAPLDANPRTLATEAVIAVLAALLAIGVGGWRAARRGAVSPRSRWSLLTAFTIVLGVGGAIALLGALAIRVGDLFELMGVLIAGAGLVVTLVGAVGVLVVASERALGALRLLLLLLIGVITAAGSFTPYVVWARGATGYRGASLLALVAMLAGIAFAGWLGNRVGHSPPTEYDPPYPNPSGSPLPRPAWQSDPYGRQHGQSGRPEGQGGTGPPV